VALFAIRFPAVHAACACVLCVVFPSLYNLVRFLRAASLVDVDRRLRVSVCRIRPYLYVVLFSRIQKEMTYERSKNVYEADEPTDHADWNPIRYM
jgi:hypothetical protein